MSPSIPFHKHRSPLSTSSVTMPGMKTTFTRRQFVSTSAMLPLALKVPAWASAAGAKDVTLAAQNAAIPIGLELYSVRNALKQDLAGTVRAVAAMGYQCVEFYAPYFEWTEAQTKDVRKLMDDLGIRCYSTHNDHSYFAPDKISRAADMNRILGCRYVVMSSAPRDGGLDTWKTVADTLSRAAESLGPNLKAGYHNHQFEFTPQNGVRPIEVLAKNTKPSVMLQLDVGTCIEAGSDPVAWIHANPGRIRSLHLKEWSPEVGKGYTVLFGEGVAKWKEILAAAESVGGVEYYLMEQEGSRFSELDTARKCLEAYRAIRPN